MDLNRSSLFIGRLIATFGVAFGFSTALATSPTVNTASTSTNPTFSQAKSIRRLQKKISQEKAPPPAFGGSFNLAQYGSLVDRQDGSYKSSLDGSLKFSYQISENYKTDSLFYYSQNTKTQEGDWDDLNLGVYRKAAPLFSQLLLSPGIIGILPMSKDSNINKEFSGALGGVARFSFSPGTFIPGFDFKFSLSLTKNLHKFENATDGKPNSAYSSIQKISAGYTFGKMSISTAFLHINTLSYQNQLRESFVHFQDLGYDFNSMIGISIGHANTGSALRPNGQDNNILLINENSSLVYASTTVNF